MASNLINQRVMEDSTYITCGALILLLSYALLRVVRGSKVTFLIYLIVLLILSNVSYIVYMSLYNTRKSLELYNQSTSSSEYRKLKLYVSLSMVFDLIHYSCFFSAMWCFAFKYWVVAVEVPKMIKDLSAS
jgi:cobalamin synthase